MAAVSKEEKREKRFMNPRRSPANSRGGPPSSSFTLFLSTGEKESPLLFLIAVKRKGKVITLVGRGVLSFFEEPGWREKRREGGEKRKKRFSCRRYPREQKGGGKDASGDRPPSAAGVLDQRRGKKGGSLAHHLGP